MTKLPLRRALAFRILKWWREMVGDLHQAECEVDHLAQRLHKIAGRMHVLEFEAYGETKPRRTMPPPSDTRVH
jgi:hypothetical protein